MLWTTQGSEYKENGTVDKHIKSKDPQPQPQEQF